MPAAVVVDPLLDILETGELVEDASTGVVEAAETVVGVFATGVVDAAAAGGVVEAAALPGAPALLVQNPCSGVTSGK